MEQASEELLAMPALEIPPSNSSPDQTFSSTTENIHSSNSLPIYSYNLEPPDPIPYNAVVPPATSLPDTAISPDALQDWVSDTFSAKLTLKSPSDKRMEELIRAQQAGLDPQRGGDNVPEIETIAVPDGLSVETESKFRMDDGSDLPIYIAKNQMARNPHSSRRLDQESLDQKLTSLVSNPESPSSQMPNPNSMIQHSKGTEQEGSKVWTLRPVLSPGLSGTETPSPQTNAFESLQPLVHDIGKITSHPPFPFNRSSTPGDWLPPKLQAHQSLQCPKPMPGHLLSPQTSPELSDTGQSSKPSENRPSKNTPRREFLKSYSSVAEKPKPTARAAAVSAPHRRRHVTPPRTKQRLRSQKVRKSALPPPRKTRTPSARGARRAPATQVTTPSNPSIVSLGLWFWRLLGLGHIENGFHLIQYLLLRVVTVWFISTFFACLKGQIMHHHDHYHRTHGGHH